MKKHLLSVALLALVMATPGCGSNDNGTTTGTTGSGTVALTATLASVPSGTTQYIVTGLDSSGNIAYGPVTVTAASVSTLTSVPDDVVTLDVKYEDAAGDVLATSSNPVTISDNNVVSVLATITSGTPVNQTGAKGATGATGAAGLPGSNGNGGGVGPAGATGVTGIPGTVGATGIAGTVGVTGATGADGIDGTTGPDGSTGATGATGDDGATGDVGVTGVTGSTGEADFFYASQDSVNGQNEFDPSINTPMSFDHISSAGNIVPSQANIVTVQNPGTYLVSFTGYVSSLSGAYVQVNLVEDNATGMDGAGLTLDTYSASYAPSVIKGQTVVVVTAPNTTFDFEVANPVEGSVVFASPDGVTTNASYTVSVIHLNDNTVN